MTVNITEKEKIPLLSKPINPPFTFRDPENPSRIYGSALSLKELADILRYIPFFSIEYHTHRIDEDMTISSDLALWLKYVLNLDDLAKEIETIAQTYTGLELKEKLISLINSKLFEGG